MGSLFASYVGGDGDLTRGSGVRFYDGERETVEVLRRLVFKASVICLLRPSIGLTSMGVGSGLLKRGILTPRARHGHLAAPTLHGRSEDLVTRPKAGIRGNVVEQTAEERGFEVICGYVDSIFVHGNNLIRNNLHQDRPRSSD